MPSFFLRRILTDELKWKSKKKGIRRRRRSRGNQRSNLKNNWLKESSLATADEEENGDGFDLKSTVSCRSYIIQPMGNLLFHGPSTLNSRNPGLGNLRVLTDQLVLDILGLLPVKELGVLSMVSKSLYVFSTHEPLWRNLVLDALNGDFSFDRSWRLTYVSTFFYNSSCADYVPSTLCLRDFYSDYLFQSWLCASLEMKQEWLEVDNIPRRRELSVDEFVSKFEEPNRPVLLEDCVENWAEISCKWDRDRLLKVCGDVKFSVGPVEMTLKDYFQYADAVKEERPLYLFDPKFGEKVAELGSDYDVPVYFREDLFSVLGQERPDYRWAIIGPTGSGSSFHVDPNSTSAWNMIIRGSKKWVMFPPEVIPPGVLPSPDGAEVACPVSIMEWFMNFYGKCKEMKRRPVECICRAGEIVFVPNGWWHLVLNLEDSVAITQNYVSRRNLLNVLDFLKRPNADVLVSGTNDRMNLSSKFENAIESVLPGTIAQLRMKQQEKLKPTFWESVTDAPQSGGFKFSF